MPYFRIQTNIEMDAPKKTLLLKKASALGTAILEKPETYMMVQIEVQVPLIFGKTSEPAAYVELKSIGLQKEKNRRIVKKNM